MKKLVGSFEGRVGGTNELGLEQIEEQSEELVECRQALMPTSLESLI